MSELVFVFHTVSTLYMTGLIWFVQLVHYPLFKRVGSESFESYQLEHMHRTSFAVSPMLIELGTAIALLWLGPEGVPNLLIYIGLGMLILIWVLTGLIQVPLHQQLKSGFNENAWRKLVLSNWIRTALWSARALIIMYMMFVLM